MDRSSSRMTRGQDLAGHSLASVSAIRDASAFGVTPARCGPNGLRPFCHSASSVCLCSQSDAARISVDLVASGRLRRSRKLAQESPLPVSRPSSTPRLSSPARNSASDQSDHNGNRELVPTAAPFTPRHYQGRSRKCIMKTKLVVSVVGLAHQRLRRLSRACERHREPEVSNQGDPGQPGRGRNGPARRAAGVEQRSQGIRSDAAEGSLGRNTKAMAAASAWEWTRRVSRPSNNSRCTTNSRSCRATSSIEVARYMVMDHKKDIAEYTKAAKMEAGDQAVTYAVETLPVLQSHLKIAQGLTKGGKAQM